MKKILTIIGGIVVVFVIIGVAIYLYVSLTSKKMVCEASEGKITLMYNDKTITGYTAKNITYNMDEQQKYAEQVGIEAYLDEFATWFRNNTSGTCEKK